MSDSQQLSLLLVRRTSETHLPRLDQAQLSEEYLEHIQNYVFDGSKVADGSQFIVLVVVGFGRSEYHDHHFEADENMLNQLKVTSIAYMIFLTLKEGALLSKQLRISFWKITIHTFCQ